MSKKGGDKDKEKEKDSTAFYRELQTHKMNEEYEKAVKVCNRILNLDPTDSLAFHCKIVSLINIGKFEDALKQMDGGNRFPELDLSFETAYCFYRQNQLSKSLKVLDSVKKEETKHSELRAQILYKLEEYDDCYGIYRNIIKNTSDDYETERKTNLSAVGAQLGDKNIILMDETETFELRYNSGCGLAAIGELEEAERVLKDAVEYARERLEEDGESEEDIEDEIGIIKVQLAYVLQKLGKEKEAQAIYNAVLKAKPSDIGLVAVASNNLVAINRDQNIFDSKKKIKAATADGLEYKLTRKQRGQIARNQALLAMFTAQVEQCRQLVEELDASAVPDKDYIMAGVLSKSGKHAEAVSQLISKTSDPERVLTSTQILLAAGEAKQAAELLASKLPPEWKYRPGVLSSMVSLYQAMDDRDSAAGILKAATEWNLQRNKRGSTSSDMAVVWQKTAEFHLNSGDPHVAAQSLEEMLRVSPDLRTLAQLVLAYAKFDLGKALDTSKRLPPFNSSSLPVDIDSLEESTFAMGKNLKKNNPLTPKTPKKDDGDGTVTKKSKKKRKRRLPKNYNPNVTPDPERWLPKRERTGLKYNIPGQRKPRKDKRKPEKFTGAQGTTPGQSETFDYSSKMAASKEAAAAAKASPQPNEPKPPTSGPGPRLQKKIQSKSKKKSSNKKQF